MTVWIWVNLFSGLVAVVYGCQKLGEKPRPLTQVSGWIYSALVFSAMFMAGHPLFGGQPHNWTEVMFNFAVALYLARRMWRERAFGKREKLHVKLMIRKGTQYESNK